MNKTLTLSRGQLHDLLARFVVENPKYRAALINDRKRIIREAAAFQSREGNVTAVVEIPDTDNDVVPHVETDADLSDSELKYIAGGRLDNFDAKREISGGLTS